MPEERIGDIKAQVGALTVGEQRLTALLDRYGEETVTACDRRAEARAPSSRCARTSPTIPDGVYSFEAYVD